MNKFNSLLISSVFLLSTSCELPKRESRLEAEKGNTIPYSLKMTLQHDEKAYTQGLVYHQDRLLESTGSGDSWIAEVNLENGKQDKKVVLDEQYFGEGITVLNNKIYQLTWKDKLGFIYDARSFRQTGSFSYDSEGWGITTDGEYLIMSDGSEKLYYLDTLTFKPVKTLSIKENGSFVDQLNELEYVEGFIFANQYETNYLLKIDPETEQVVGRVDLSPIANEIKRRFKRANVLNGIAYNPKTGDMLVTGKLWPRAYLIELGK